MLLSLPAGLRRQRSLCLRLASAAHLPRRCASYPFSPAYRPPPSDGCPRRLLRLSEEWQRGAGSRPLQTLDLDPQMSLAPARRTARRTATTPASPLAFPGTAPLSSASRSGRAARRSPPRAAPRGSGRAARLSGVRAPAHAPHRGHTLRSPVLRRRSVTPSPASHIHSLRPPLTTASLPLPLSCPQRT